MVIANDDLFFACVYQHGCRDVRGVKTSEDPISHTDQFRAFIAFCDGMREAGSNLVAALCYIACLCGVSGTSSLYQTCNSAKITC